MMNSAICTLSWSQIRFDATFLESYAVRNRIQMRRDLCDTSRCDESRLNDDCDHSVHDFLSFSHPQCRIAEVAHLTQLLQVGLEPCFVWMGVVNPCLEMDGVEGTQLAERFEQVKIDNEVDEKLESGKL